MLGAEIGIPKHQPDWELYTLLRALLTWEKVIFASRGQVTIYGDALGIMFSAIKFKARSPSLNKLAMLMALVFAPHGRSLDGVHLWSEQNTLADFLSRAVRP